MTNYEILALKFSRKNKIRHRLSHLPHIFVLENNPK